jgi:hypothetical protein
MASRMQNVQFGAARAWPSWMMSRWSGSQYRTCHAVPGTGDCGLVLAERGRGGDAPGQ